MSSAGRSLPGDGYPVLPSSAGALEYNAYRAFQMGADVISHNIANANTTGYKRCRVEFQELAGPSVFLTGTTSAQGWPQMRDPQAVSVRRIFTNGRTVYTGEPLDLAIVGEGFFEVQLPDGLKAYTRDGAFVVAPDGRITTRGGLPLQGGFQPIERKTTSITVGCNGEVSCVSPNGMNSFQVQLCRFANPAGLEAIPGNFFKETSASGTPEQFTPGDRGYGFLVQGFLESSNVCLSEELFELERVRNALKALVKIAKARLSL